MESEISQRRKKNKAIPILLGGLSVPSMRTSASHLLRRGRRVDAKALEWGEGSAECD